MSDAGTVPQPASSLEGKDGWLEVLSAEPLVLQTPLELLAGRRITDTQSLYVRNVEDLPDAMTIQPLGLQDWAVEVGGLIERSPVAVPAIDLLDMDQVEVEMVLQCSGNGRTRFGGAPGTPWGLGGVGNVRFAGVPLSAVLDRWSIRVDPQVTFVTAGSRATGTGRAPEGFEHSLPVVDVLDRSIPALQLNGEPLPGVHGGPARLVTPDTSARCRSSGWTGFGSRQRNPRVSSMPPNTRCLCRPPSRASRSSSPSRTAGRRDGCS